MCWEGYSVNLSQLSATGAYPLHRGANMEKVKEKPERIQLLVDPVLLSLPSPSVRQETGPWLAAHHPPVSPPPPMHRVS